MTMSGYDYEGLYGEDNLVSISHIMFENITFKVILKPKLGWQPCEGRAVNVLLMLTCLSLYHQAM